MRRIPVNGRNGTVRAWVLVDDEDYERLARFKWSLGGRDKYARRKVPGEPDRYMHREVLGLTRGDGLQSDHINGDTFDNRRSNLRVVTHAQNQQNRKGGHGRHSRHRGVTYWVTRDRWVAYVEVGGKRIYRYRKTEEEAAAAARELRAEYMPFSREAA